MKRALALVALTAAALLATAPLASADTAAASGTQQLLPFELPTTPYDGDTSWGGACETPDCRPLS
ncbi:hypothetical protein ACFV1L_27070 [Kitasatospora sp. NPDC059646]|uniref:hypothetical protein n=1 Tax=Kitasatospora sp. NPDC059646 TaxID=3346893 RepID=UPI00367B0E4C